MLDIQFTENIKIISDKLNYIVCVPNKNKKTGGITWVSKHWYSSLEDLIHNLLQTEILASDAKTLQELSNVIGGVESRLNALIRASGRQ